MNTNQPMSLRNVVSELLACYSRVNKKHSFSIVNAIPADLMITKSGNWLAPLMGDLYDIILTRGHEQAIRISARQVNGQIRLFVADRVTSTLPTLQPLPASHQFGFRI